MNTSKIHFLVLSLPMITAMFPYSYSHAAVRVTNSSIVKEQAQLNAARTAAAAVSLEPQPARVVTNEQGETVSIPSDQMDACNSIYPNGVFDWRQPTTGTLAQGPATCVALVELRSQSSSGGVHPVLARAYLAAGDGMKCNIDEFPDVTSVGLKYEYPADNPPTMEDVKKVMAQENKSNAGFKILGAALVGGIGGNLLGNDGTDSVLGTSKEKIKSTAIGAVAAGGLMTASTQVNDYKTGNIILSTGVNTAAGAAMGNLSATGDDVLNFTKCKIGNSETETNCLYGTLTISGGSSECNDNNNLNDGYTYLYNIQDDKTYKCAKATEIDNKTTTDSCRPQTVRMSKLDCAEQNCCSQDDIKNGVNSACKAKLQKSNPHWTVAEKDGKPTGKIEKQTENSPCTGGKDCYIEITAGCEILGNSVVGVIQVPEKVTKKFFGYKRSDWDKLKQELKGAIIYSVDGKYQLCDDGKPLTEDGDKCPGDNRASLDKFSPSNQSAEDSDMIDFGNKARMKSTMIGAGGGAALGALAGASGADQAIQERYLAAKREYDDSLNSAPLCYTGERYMGKYNEPLTLPSMKNAD